MAITFPTTLDSFPNPISTDLLENATAALDHDVQHSNANDAIEAIEAKLGVDGSAVTTSHSYKLSGVATGDKAVSLTGIETLTNKTLTAPKIALGSDAKGDIFQLSDANGTLTRLRATTNGDIISWNDGTDQWEAIPNPAGSNASTTVKGVVEEGTLAQVLARTGTGETGARLFVGPENLTTVQTYDYAVDSVGTDSYAITVTPAPTAYVAGQVFRFKAGTANTGGCTLNVNGLGAKSILKNVSSALLTGDILADQIVEVIYDGTNMQLLSRVSQTLAYANGTTTKNSADASTTQNIAHGLGVIPKKIRIVALGNNGGASANDVNSYKAETVYNGTTQSSVSTYGQSGSPYATSASTFSLNASQAGGDQTGVVTFDATNIIITWTKNSSPSGTYQLLWEAQV